MKTALLRAVLDTGLLVSESKRAYGGTSIGDGL